MSNPTLIENIVYSEDFANLKETSLRCEEQGQEWHWQGRMVVRGSIKWVEIRSNHELTQDGVVIRRGIVQDITALKKTEKESDARYQSLVERLPLAVVIQNEKNILYANAQATMTLGSKDKNELLGSDVLRFLEADGIEEDSPLPLAWRNLPAAMVEKKCLRRDGKFVDVE
jgi:PAS domain S-box-containing protein